MRRLSLLSILTAILASTPAGATVPLSTLATDTLAGNGYAAYRISVPTPSSLRLGVAVPAMNDAESLGYAGWLLNGDGSFRDFFAVTTWFPGAGAHAEVAGTIVDQRTALPRSVFAPTLALQYAIATVPAGEFIVVFAVAADGHVEPTVTLDAGSGVAVVNRVTGSGGFMLREQDFSGGVNIQAGASIAQPKVMSNVSVVQGVAGRLFGWFGSGADFYPSIRMGYDAPDRTYDGGTSYTISNAPAGDYRFRIDEAKTLQFIWAWGVGVTLP